VKHHRDQPEYPGCLPAHHRRCGLVGRVIIGGIIIASTGWFLVDPLLSILISVRIIAGAIGLMTESVSILLESALRISPCGGRRGDREVPGVPRSIPYPCVDHHLGRVRAERPCHRQRPDVSNSRPMLEAIRELLAERFKILHSTIQFECQRVALRRVCPLPRT